jgi:hypothetical protein
MTNTNEPEQGAAEDVAQRTASRSGRVLAYWRWRKISQLLEAAGQLALFTHADVADTPTQEDSEGS